MIYETHLTIDPADTPSLEIARRWADDQRLKWTHILLDSGVHASQPMVTFHGRESLIAQRARGERLAAELADLSVTVVRHKIEVDARKVVSCEPPVYFECHLKLQLSSADDYRRAVEIAARHTAHLSRNARRRSVDGSEQRFLTLRHDKGEAERAAADQRRLLAELQHSGITVLETEAERVIYDSNFSLDEGWTPLCSAG